MNFKQFLTHVIFFIELSINFHINCIKENEHNGNFYMIQRYKAGDELYNSNLNFESTEQITDIYGYRLDHKKKYSLKIVSPKQFKTSISGLTINNHFESQEKLTAIIDRLASRVQIPNNKNHLITMEITEDRKYASSCNIH